MVPQLSLQHTGGSNNQLTRAGMATIGGNKEPNRTVNAAETRVRTVVAPTGTTRGWQAPRGFVLEGLALVP